MKYLTILFQFILIISIQAQPANDDCAGAISIPVEPMCMPVQYTFVNATNGSNECDYRGVWFKVVIPESGILIFQTTPPGTNDDTEVKVYSGTCGNLTLESEDCQDSDNTANDNHEQVAIFGTPGEAKLIVVDDRDDEGTFSVCAREIEATPSGSGEVFIYNFNDNLQDLCSGNDLAELSNTGAFVQEPLLNNETVYEYEEEDGFEINTEDFGIGSSYSIEMYLRSTEYSDYVRLLDFNDGETDNGLYFHENDLVVYDYIQNDSDPFLDPNAYYHIVMTYNNLEIRLYINGVLYQVIDDTLLAGLPSAFNNNIRVLIDDSGEDAPGFIRMLKIYNYALNATEVTMVAENPTSESCELPVSIPTLSQWGLIFLTLISLIIGRLFLIKKHSITLE